MKIPPRRVPSDDCTVCIGREIKDGQIVNAGTPYRVHEGEWVEVLPIVSVRRWLSLRHMMDGTASDGASLEKALDALCHELSERVMAWNWTDMSGQPLPQPYRNEAVFRDLSDDEILWLALASQGESPGERKNASAPSAPK